MTIDTYMLDIAEKDEMSQLLAQLAEPTLDMPYVTRITSGKNGLNFIKIPEEEREKFVLVGHSSSGDHRITQPGQYAASVLYKAIADARKINAIPLAFANVTDARTTDENLVRTIGVALRDIGVRERVANITGELAKLGPMINCPCNITQTMISLLDRNSLLAQNLPREFEKDKTKYFVFDPAGKYVTMNSDGIGTKSLIYSRFKEFLPGILDLFAMQFDDKAKFGGGAIATFNVLETQGNVPYRDMQEYAAMKASEMGAFSVMQHVNVGNRLSGPHGEENLFNASGTLVSLVDENMINNLPRPNQGDYLIAIKGYGRSNGFTARRDKMVEWFGQNWHETDGGKRFGEFLTKPSILFYPVFTRLINEKLATSVTHMSGGAYRDKLAKQLTKHSLYAEIGLADKSPQLFTPDEREIAFANEYETSNAYAKFAMGNEGFITTNRPEGALRVLQNMGLEARVVGRLEKRSDIMGLKLRAFNGDIVDYSRKIA